MFFLKKAELQICSLYAFSTQYHPVPDTRNKTLAWKPKGKKNWIWRFDEDEAYKNKKKTNCRAYGWSVFKQNSPYNLQ